MEQMDKTEALESGNRGSLFSSHLMSHDRTHEWQIQLIVEDTWTHVQTDRHWNLEINVIEKCQITDFLMKICMKQSNMMSTEGKYAKGVLKSKELCSLLRWCLDHSISVNNHFFVCVIYTLPVFNVDCCGLTTDVTSMRWGMSEICSLWSLMSDELIQQLTRLHRFHMCTLSVILRWQTPFEREIPVCIVFHFLTDTVAQRNLRDPDGTAKHIIVQSTECASPTARERSPSENEVNVSSARSELQRIEHKKKPQRSEQHPPETFYERFWHQVWKLFVLYFTDVVQKLSQA